MFMKGRNANIIAFGYVKEQDGVYTAICVNMGLFGQGKTPEQALNRVLKAVTSYVAYVLERHPDEREKFLNRPVSANFVKEYKEGIRGLRRLTESKVCKPRQSSISFIPVRSFAEKVSFAQAQ